MVRKLAIWMLLAPLSLNGLWMACEDARAVASDAAASSAQPQEMAHCAKMCPTKQQTEPGAICLLTAGVDNGSMLVIVFGVAVMPMEIRVEPPVLVAKFLPELSASYLSPSLDHSTPPPRA